MVLRTSWVTLLVSYLVLAGVAGLTVAWLAWFTGRLEVPESAAAGTGLTEAIRLYYVDGYRYRLVQVL